MKQLILKEQVSICIRHVSTDMDIYEDLGLFETGSTTAEVLTTIIKDVLCRSGLDLLDCRGQAYDGSSNMSGRISGVQARIVNTQKLCSLCMPLIESCCPRLV